MNWFFFLRKLWKQSSAGTSKPLLSTSTKKLMRINLLLGTERYSGLLELEELCPFSHVFRAPLDSCRVMDEWRRNTISKNVFMVHEGRLLSENLVLWKLSLVIKKQSAKSTQPPEVVLLCLFLYLLCQGREDCDDSAHSFVEGCPAPAGEMTLLRCLSLSKRTPHNCSPSGF